MNQVKEWMHEPGRSLRESWLKVLDYSKGIENLANAEVMVLRIRWVFWI